MFMKEDFTSKITEFFQPVTDQITSELEGIKESEASLQTVITSELDGIKEAEVSLRTEIGALHSLYHEEFAGRLRSMQAELDHYHDLDKGRAYDGILADIARIYDNYENLPEELEAILEDTQNDADQVSDRQICEDVRYLLSDLMDLIIQYGATPIRSKPGETRDLQHTQIIQRIPTDDPARHLTVAQSYNTGFRIGQRTIIKEQVNVYQYKAPASVPPTPHNADTAGQPLHRDKAPVLVPETAAVTVRQTTTAAATGNDHGAVTVATNVTEHDVSNKKEG